MFVYLDLQSLIYFSLDWLFILSHWKINLEQITFNLVASDVSGLQ